MQERHWVSDSIPLLRWGEGEKVKMPPGFFRQSFGVSRLLTGQSLHVLDPVGGVRRDDDGVIAPAMIGQNPVRR